MESFFPPKRDGLLSRPYINHSADISSVNLFRWLVKASYYLPINRLVGKVVTQHNGLEQDIPPLICVGQQQGRHH